MPFVFGHMLWVWVNYSRALHFYQAVFRPIDFACRSRNKDSRLRTRIPHSSAPFHTLIASRTSQLAAPRRKLHSSNRSRMFPDDQLSYRNPAILIME